MFFRQNNYELINAKIKKKAVEPRAVDPHCFDAGAGPDPDPDPDPNPGGGGEGQPHLSHSPGKILGTPLLSMDPPDGRAAGGGISCGGGSSLVSKSRPLRHTSGPAQRAWMRIRYRTMVFKVFK